MMLPGPSRGPAFRAQERWSPSSRPHDPADAIGSCPAQVTFAGRQIERSHVGTAEAAIGWMIDRQSEGANLPGQSKAPVMLHGSAVMSVALGMPAAFTLFVDDRARHAQLVQLQGKDHPDRTAPNDDHGHAKHKKIVR